MNVRKSYVHVGASKTALILLAAAAPIVCGCNRAAESGRPDLTIELQRLPPKWGKVTFRTDGVDRSLDEEGNSREWKGTVEALDSGLPRVPADAAIGFQCDDGLMVVVISSRPAKDIGDDEWAAALLRLQELSTKIDTNAGAFGGQAIAVE